jgi:hypothetical protein
MSWDAIGAIGQMLGALALFGVFIQIRHAREESRRSILEQRNNVGRELDFARSGNERLGQIRSKANAALLNTPHPAYQALMDQAGLTFEEAEAAFFDQMAWFRHVRLIVAYMDETPDDRSWCEAGIRQTYFHEALGRLWYQHMKGDLPTETVRYIDGVLARAA